MKAYNMYTKKGNKVANHFIIEGDIYKNDLWEGMVTYFQSYDKVIVRKKKITTIDHNRTPIMQDEYIIHLDINYWDYSVTTGKYRNIFLGETKKETEKKIKEGVYILSNLNE